jgi:hypothetical protein
VIAGPRIAEDRIFVAPERVGVECRACAPDLAGIGMGLDSRRRTTTSDEAVKRLEGRA